MALSAARMEWRILLVEIKHEEREVEELRTRKRTLIQSKLDDLDKKDAPFHDEGAEAMDKMQEANEMREEDMKKTEEEVKAATDAADAPTMDKMQEANEMREEDMKKT